VRPEQPEAGDVAGARYLAGPAPRAFVHRGWQFGELAGMENSLSALRRCLDEGFRYLEIDVHATSDGVVVVSHDAELDRITTGTGPIVAQPWRRVAEAPIRGREPLATLRQVIEELPDALLNIDVKADAAVEPTLGLLADTDAWDRVCLASFSSARLSRLRTSAGARLLTSCSPVDAVALRIRGWLRAARLSSWGRAIRVPARLAQLPRRHGPLTVVEPHLLATAHELGMEVHVWVVDDPAEMRELLDMGVDGLVTDRPDLLREVLAERGQWPAG
jgi:glycerophosphoryl diester phosphodiesterase